METIWPKVKSHGLCQGLTTGKKTPNLILCPALKHRDWELLSENTVWVTPLACMQEASLCFFSPQGERYYGRKWEEDFQSRLLPIQSQVLNHRCCDIKEHVSLRCVKVSLTWCCETGREHSLDHLRELNWRTNWHLLFAICCLVFYVVQMRKQTENSNVVYPPKL